MNGDALSADEIGLDSRLPALRGPARAARGHDRLADHGPRATPATLQIAGLAIQLEQIAEGEAEADAAGGGRRKPAAEERTQPEEPAPTEGEEEQ